MGLCARRLKASRIAQQGEFLDRVRRAAEIHATSIRTYVLFVKRGKQELFDITRGCGCECGR